MKKLFLLISLSLVLSVGHSQNIVLMNNVLATTSGTYSITPLQKIQLGTKIGTIQITTSASFNGTTTSDTLQFSDAVSPGSRDWSDVRDNSGNVVVWTINAPSSTSHSYTATFQTVGVRWYRIIHVKGDASAGTINAILNLE